jgi:acyl-CoA reductase-like NAD-dependent aldehyde dehydrogenase
LGSLITPVAGQRVERLVKDAISKGATVAGGNFKVDGAIAQPLFLTGVKPDMEIYYQESFGPTVALYEFETLDEAIQLANDTEYGLVASVFSEDISTALAVARKIRSGSCHINGPTVHGKLQ